MDRAWVGGLDALLAVFCDDYHKIFVMKGLPLGGQFVVQWGYHCTSIGEYHVQDIRIPC